MADKQIKTRILQKHDVAANWAKATNFIPKKGELIIYDAEYNTSGAETTPVRFKIGNGSATVNALPFVKTDNGVKLGGGTRPSGETGIEGAICIDQVYANILEGTTPSRSYFPQLMSRIESGQMLLMGINLSTETIVYIMHITGVVENEVTASQGTPVEGSNAGVYHFIIAEKFVDNGSEKILLWAEKAGSAFSKYRSAGTGSTETFSASVTAGWNPNYVDVTTGLCNLSSLVNGGNFTWLLMSTVMEGQDVGSTPTGNYFFAGSPFTIEYEAQVGQMAVLDRQLSGGYQKGYYIGSINLESSVSSWQNYQADTDIGSSIKFNTALKNSTIGACLNNICSLSPSGNCIVRTYGDSSATYKVVPILSDSADGNGEWTLYAGAMLLGSYGSYYGLFEASHPLTIKDPFGDAVDSIYYWNQWEHLSSTGDWTTDAGSRKAKYINFEALSLLYQYAMFGEYNIVKLPLRKVAEAQGSYAMAVAQTVQDKQDTLSDAQIAAANSGITAAKVTKYDGYESTINGKQAAITASNKLSASLVSGLATVATSGSYNDLANKPSIPTKTSQLTNDSGFTSNVGTITGIKMNGSNKGTSGVVDLGTVITQHQDISGKQDKLTAGSNISISGNTISATVPTKVSQLTNDSNYATTSQVNAKYTKPSGGIPKTDLASDVQTSLSKADTALQEHQNISGKANLSGGNTFNGQQIFKNANTGAIAECVMNNTAYDSFTVRNVSDNTQKSAISAGYVWCQDNDNVYSQFKPAGIYYGNDTAGYEGTLKFPTGISGEKTIATTEQIPDVSGKANLTGGNSWTGTQTFTAPGSSNYSINASGYVKGSWLQAPSTGHSTSKQDKVCVLDGSGWVYYRTPAEILTDAGGAKSSDIPDVSKMVTTDTAQDIFGVKRFSNGIKLGDGNELVGASDVSNIQNTMPQKDGTLAVLSDIPQMSLSGTTLTITL